MAAFVAALRVTLGLARPLDLPHERRPRFQSGRFGLDPVI